MALPHRLIGIAARFYWRLRRPRTLGVRAIVVNTTGQIALVRHTYVDAWYLPGGGVGKGESFEAALHRELREEVGLVGARIDRVLGVYHSRKEAKDDHIVIFVVSAGDQGLRIADAMEIEQVGWFAVDRLPDSVSPATLHRIEEYRQGRTGLGRW